MRNLRGWWRHEIAQGENCPHLSAVSVIYIPGCPKLKGQMPVFKGTEYLSLNGVNAEVVTELLLPNCSPFENNSKLLELKLNGIEGLISLQEGWIKHLAALQRLDIIQCGDLKWVSRRGLAHLTALKSLSLGCVEIGEEDDKDDKMESEAGMPWKALLGLEELELRFEYRTIQLPKYGVQYLHSLRKLDLGECAELYLSRNTLLVNMKLVELCFSFVEYVIEVEEDRMMAVEPQHIQLRKLSIWSRVDAKWVDDIPWFSLSSSLTELQLWLMMEEREQLPDGIQHLTSQYLSIGECEKWRALPVWIPKLTSLIDLYIWGCSAELERRCTRETGEDWHLISHIPSISISITTRRRLNNESNDDDEEKEEGSSKMGCCGHLSLFK